MGVMRCELIMPFELAGVGVECQERSRIEIVALAIATVETGIGVACTPIKQIQVWIVSARHPGGSATLGHRLGGRPCLAARFAGPRDRIEAPQTRAALRVV